MSDAYVAISLTIGVLALFGISMFGFNVLGRSGLVLAQSLVERYAPIVYTAVLVGATVGFVLTGWLNPLRALRISDPVGTGIAALAAPLLALFWYVVELAVASAQVRTAGMLEPADARKTVAGLSGRPAVWWTLAVLCAVAEEFVFRGMLQSSVAAQWGGVAAVALGALLFGLHHVSLGVPSIVSKAFGGALMGMQVMVGGSVATAMLTHLCFQWLVFRRLRRKAVVAGGI